MHRQNKIQFAVLLPGAKDGDYGSAAEPATAIYISEPQRDLDGMLNKEEVVIPGPIDKIIIKFSYPLGRPAKFAIRPDDTKVGFRRLELAQSICECYRRIYETEAKTQSHEPQSAPGSLNRGFSDGKYCIWGHDIYDLYLVHVQLNESTGLWELGVDS